MFKEEKLEFNKSIFAFFDEVSIQGDDNLLFRSLSLCIDPEDSHDIAR